MEFKWYFWGFFHHGGEGRLDTGEAQVRRGYFVEYMSVRWGIGLRECFDKQRRNRGGIEGVF